MQDVQAPFTPSTLRVKLREMEAIT
jgi:hypothetical protein